MASIESMKGRRETQSPSGYTRLFGDAVIGNLMSRAQGAVIASGIELEKLIWERVQRIDDFDLFMSLSLPNKKPGMWVARKRQVKLSKYINTKFEPDFVAFDLTKRVCYVLEIKDGDQFDTKKSSGERDALHDFVDAVRYSVPLDFQIRICCFNANSKVDIYDGLKHRFSMSEILTGQELCGLLRISYADIAASRCQDQQSNVRYFVKGILSSPQALGVVMECINGTGMTEK